MKIIKKIFKSLGPGFITGASDDDPSGIATYAQTGALFGFSQAWTALFSFPLMAAVQEMCGRIGLTTGRGLAGVIKMHYSKPVLYMAVFLLFAANTINIGTDLGAMAASAQLIFNIPFVFWLVAMVIVSLLLEIFVSYKTYCKYLKYLTFALFSYVVTAFIVRLDWKEVLISTLVPHFQFNSVYLFNIVAVLGTTISPYLFFWQASEEVEEEVASHKIKAMDVGRPHVSASDMTRLRTDTIVGMFFSNLVMWFIIVTTGATLFSNKVGPIQTSLGASEALRPLAGDLAYILFSLGVIGTGFLAVPILAGSASYAVSEAFGWRTGLYRKLKNARGFYASIIVATLVGILVNFIGVSPISALYYTALINGIIAPPLLVLILLISNNSKIMGLRVNGRWQNFLGTTAVVVMTLSAVALFVVSR